MFLSEYHQTDYLSFHVLSQPCLSKLFRLDNYYCESKGFTSRTYAALKNKTDIYLLINKLSINMLITPGRTPNQSFLARHPSSRWVKVGCCYFLHCTAPSNSAELLFCSSLFFPSVFTPFWASLSPSESFSC